MYICEYHKRFIQSVRTKRKRRESEDDSGDIDGDLPEVELYNLQVYFKSFVIKLKVLKDISSIVYNPI